MPLDLESIWQTESIDKVMEFYISHFKKPLGRTIVSVKWYFDPAKKTVIFDIITTLDE